MFHKMVFDFNVEISMTCVGHVKQYNAVDGHCNHIPNPLCMFM